MTILITGASGQLGKELQKYFSERKIDFVAADSDTLDITNEVLVDTYIEELRPNVICHCAAYTAVDDAEDYGKELNRLININGTRYVARAASRVDATFVYISTDYVFDGTKLEEYTVDDIPNPKNEYGKAKYEGELVVKELIEKYYIVRISWLFGEFGKNFVYTMQRLAQEKSELNVVNDQVGRPTWARTLVEFLVHLIDTHAEYGTYHFSNDSKCSWYEFAKYILKDTQVIIQPVDSSAFPQKAHRPKHSVMDLSKTKATGFHVPTWQEALDLFLGR